MTYQSMLLFTSSVFMLGITPRVGSAGEGNKGATPCEPGYQWVEETVYKQVERNVCKLVPEVKKVKKIVYTCKEDPFCVRRKALGKSSADGCENGNEGGKEDGKKCVKCKGPYERKILVKTEITVEEHTMKCVMEKVMETVPCVVRKKVPYAATPVAP